MRDTMALQLRRTASMRVRLVTTLIAAFAFIVQPYVGIIASQNVNALAVTNEAVINLDTYFVKSLYKGIATDITVNNVTDANGVKVEVSRTTDGSIVKTAKSSVLNTLNTGAAATAPIVIQSGSYSEAGSGSWNMPVGNPWTSTTTPTLLTVTVTRDGGPDLIATKNITPTMGTFATLAEVMPTPAVSTSSTTFVNDPKYVRENNGGDLTAQLVTPDSTTDVRFFVDGNVSAPIAGLNVGGAGATTSWWRLNTPLAAGEHTISAEVKIADQWYPVSDTGIVYSLDTPTATYVLPNDTKNVFRPSDNPVRVKADDQFNQFKSMDVKIGATTHTILRADCDLRAAGNYVLCDVDTSSTWTNLSEGVHTAVTSVKTQANNRLDGLTSRQFTIDGTAPQMLNVAIVSPTATSIYKDSVVLAHYVKETGQLNGVEFYVTKLRADGQCDPNAPKVLSSQSAQFVNHSSANDTWYYRTTVDTSSLNGVNCIFSVAEDAAGSHSNPQVKKFSANFDNTAPTYTVTSPLAGDVLATETQGNKIIVRGSFNDNPGGSGANYIQFQLVKDGNGLAVVTKHYAANGEILAEFDTTGLVDGEYYINVLGAADAVGNWAPAPHASIKVVIDNTAPAKPTITSPGIRTYHKTAPIKAEWTPVADTNGIKNYQIQYIYADGHTFNGTLCDGVNACREVPGNQTWRNHQPGTDEQGKMTIKVRAIDNAGNVGPWSDAVYYTYDHKAPDTNIVAPTGLVGNSFTVSGDAVDNLGLNRVYVQLVNRENNQRYGGTTINLIPEGASAHWSKTFDANALNLPDGNYAAHVSVTDMAGNSSSAGWTDNFAVDTTPPEGAVAYTGGATFDDVIYLKSINDLKFNATLTDVQALEHTSYAVWKSDSNFQNRTLFCGNWNGSITSVAISGTSDSVSGDVKDCSPTGDWSNGSYVIMHVVYDGAGNLTYFGGAYPGQKFVIDNENPTSIITQPIDGLVTNGNSLFIEGTASDPNFSFYRYYVWNDANVRVTPDVKKYVAVNGDILGDAIDISGLGNGTYRLRLSTADMANNWVAAYATFTVDRTPPSVAIDPLAPLTNDNTPTVTGTIELGASLELKENGVTVTPTITGTTWSYTPGAALADAEYEYIATATDIASNVSVPVTSKVTVDTVAPNFTVVDYGQTGNVIQPNVNYTPSAGDSYSWSAAPAGVTISGSTTLRPTFTVTKDGDYSFNLTIRDAAGNEDTKTFNFTYKTPATPLVSDDTTTTAGVFTGVTLTNATAAPVILADDGDGVQAVLGATDTSADTTEEKLAAVDPSDVKGAETTATQDDNKADAGCGTFLGICWYWWIPIVIAAILAAYYLFRPRREEV